MKAISVGILMTAFFALMNQGIIATPDASPVASPAATPVASPAAQMSVTEVESTDDFFVGASMIQGEGVERYIWDETAVDFSGMGLQPISFTVGNHEQGVWIFAEFKNISGAPLLTPFMQFDALYDGSSFGPQTVWSPQYEVAPDESVYYTGINVYGGTILYGDWTDFQVTFDPGVAWGSELSTLDVRLGLDEAKVFNDGNADATNLYIEAIGRDSGGVYMGICGSGSLNATVPAGLFVRIPDSVSLKTGPNQSCLAAASDLTSRLDTSPISADSFIVVVPRP